MKNVYYIINLGFSRITPAGLLVKARNMVSKLTGNVAFPTPTPSLALVTAAADTLEEAINAHDLNPGPREVTDRNLAFQEVKGLVTDLGGYVQAASNGDLDLIQSAGCGVRKSASPIGELPAPKRLVATANPHPGRIDVSWGGVRGRSMYELEICQGDPNVEDNWKFVLLTTKNRYSAMDLSSDTVYFFRVKTLGVAGISPVSEVTNAKAA